MCHLPSHDTQDNLRDLVCADAVIELTNKPLDNKNDGSNEEDKVNVNSSLFMVMVQNVVGGAMSKLSSNKMFVSKSAQELIKKMRLWLFEDTVTQDYVGKYVPQILQHNNRKGMSWIQEKLILFSNNLTRMCRVATTGRNSCKKQHLWISNGLETVRNNKSLLSQFQKIVLTEMVSMFDQLLCKAFYQLIAEYSLRLFAKYTNKKDFSRDSSSLSRMKFLAQLACGAKTSNNGKPKQKKATNKKKRAFATMLGITNQSACVNDSNPLVTANIGATPLTVNISSSNPAGYISPATQATAMDATPETTSPNGQPAAKKPRQKKQTRKEIKLGT